MDKRHFEKLVQQAIGELPLEFRRRLQNVAVIVEDRPSLELLNRLDMDPEDTLFGLYEGVPLTERGFEPPLYPDRIWIFQQPIEDACKGDEAVKDEVKITMVHEIAHFFGLDDEHLEELGY